MTATKEVNFVSAVLYLGREEKNIGAFLQMLFEVFDTNFQKYEIICVDDGASAEAIQEVHDFRKERAPSALSLVHMANGRTPQGREKSMVAGIDAAIGDYVFEFDTMSMDFAPTVIMEAYRKTAEGYDIVSAAVPQQDVSFVSRLFYGIYNRYSRTPYRLGTERFRVLSRRAINRVESFSKIIPYRKAVYAFSGVKIANIPYVPVAGVRKASDGSDERWETASDAIVLFTNVAYKISLFFSILMAFIMLAFGIYVVFVYFSQNRPVEGWAPMVGMMCLGFLAVFFLQTIIFKYLEMILRLEFKKQQYIVSGIEKL